MGFNPKVSGEFKKTVGHSVKVAGVFKQIGALYVKVSGSFRAVTLPNTTDVLQSTPISQEFGRSVAIDGDTMVAGAPGDDDPASQSGSAYVYFETADVYAQQQRLVASDQAESNLFGQSVAISGDTIAVGSPGVNFSEGAVYVFTRSGTTWTQQQKLVASDGALFDSFGQAVALEGDTLIVGAPGDQVGSNSDQGSVYVFDRSAGVWSETQKLTASDGATDDDFGASVSLSGTQIAIGAPFNDNRGSAYVFELSGTWTQSAILLPSDTDSFQTFGYSISIDQGYVAVGAFTADVSGLTSAGAAYVFTESLGAWVEQVKLTNYDPEASDNFGTSVSVDGPFVYVGARFADGFAGLGTNNVGAVFQYIRSGTTWTFSGGLSIDISFPGSPQFGTAVDAKDGRIAVGAPSYDTPSLNAGLVQVFR